MSGKLPRRIFQDSWRPEDKALESAEEEQLATEFPAEIARQRAERHQGTPPLRGFERSPDEASGEVPRDARRFP